MRWEVTPFLRWPPLAVAAGDEAKDIEELGKGDREQAMRRLCERENPPGVVTYLDGGPGAGSRRAVRCCTSGAVEYVASRGAPAAPAYPVETRWSDGHDNGFRRHPVDVREGRLPGGRHDGRGRIEVAAADCAPHPRCLTGRAHPV